MNKKDYQKPSIWVMRFQFPQSPLLASQGMGINGTRNNYNYPNTDDDNDDDWDVDENSSIWKN